MSPFSGAKCLIGGLSPFSIACDCGTIGAMMDRADDKSHRKPLRNGLDQAGLQRLALAYVGRYATTKKKLSTYLTRKIRDRGWDGERAPRVDAVVDQMVALHYVDDKAFAQMKSDGLTRRGYGPARVRVALRSSGVSDEDGSEALAATETSAMDAARAFAKRKRLGPFGATQLDQAQHQKALAAMCRAGHSFEIARSILSQTDDFFQDEQ